jgi:hypothetical protein
MPTLRTGISTLSGACQCGGYKAVKVNREPPGYVPCKGSHFGKHKFERLTDNQFDKCMLCGEPRFALIDRSMARESGPLARALNKPLSDAMLKILRNRAAGRKWYVGIEGRSSQGGAQASLYALKRRGLIDSVGAAKVTDEGRRVLEAANGT